jgi:hypothetical protein
MPFIKLNNKLIKLNGGFLKTSIETRFIITVDTTKIGSASDTFILPTTGLGYDCSIDWGDNTSSNHTGAPGNITHVYTMSGTYQIKISGTFPRIYFNNTGDRLKLMSIDNWGIGAWSSLSFWGCANMVANYNDTPNLSNVTSVSYMFHSCTQFNGQLNWNTTNLQILNRCLYMCVNFNQPLLWDTSNVVDMQYIFRGDNKFNQNLNWNTEKVNTFNNTFLLCSTLKQDFSSFKIRNDADLTSMFQSCNLNSTGTSTNYDNTLIAWANDPLTSTGRVFNGGISKYGTGAGKTARDLLTLPVIDGGFGWTITDGGPI